jgi:hypothetical protein
MSHKTSEFLSQCHNALETQGFCIFPLALSEEILKEVRFANYNALDEHFQTLTSPGGLVFDTLKTFCPVKQIEFIISLRESKNEWEEDGIWHDDGSRILAFSLSLTINRPQGGILEFRKKGDTESQKIPTPDYGHIIVFKTGVDGYEHKINAVTHGQRLIIAGWCYPSIIS